MQGSEVEQSYRRFMDALLVGDTLGIAFAYRCDAPGLRRQMRMSMSRVGQGAEPGAIRFQSTTLSEDARPPINILDSASIMAALQAETALPLVTLCSFCHCVLTNEAAAPNWVPVEEYYRRGGAERVCVSHGLCPHCPSALDALRHGEPAAGGAEPA